MIVALVATPYSGGREFGIDLARALGFTPIAVDGARSAFEASDSAPLVKARSHVSFGVVPSDDAWALAWWEATPTNADAVLVCFPPTLAALTAYESYAAQPVLLVARLATAELVDSTRTILGCPPIEVSKPGALKRFTKQMRLVLDDRRWADLLLEAPVEAAPLLIAEQIAERLIR